MCETLQLFHCCFHKYDLLPQNSLLDYLQELELVGDDVVAIATHCHFDHSGGLHNFSEVIYRDLSYMFIKPAREARGHDNFFYGNSCNSGTES